VGKIAVKARYHKEPRKLDDDLRLTPQVLGTGLNGNVLLAVSKSMPTQKYAVKSLKLQGRPEEHTQRLLREMEIFLSLDHPRIARLHEVYESKHRLDLVMEYMEGGELFDRIANKKGVFPEEDAAMAIWQMLLAISYIHAKGIVHRDIKLENWLYARKDGNLLKLIDFGFSRQCDPNKKMGLACGTLSYMAPEVFHHSYTSKCDMWSLGVTAFSLLMGYMPFKGSAQQQARDIEQGKYILRPEKWDQLSVPAQDFLKSLLQVDQKERLTAQAALQHPWIATMIKEQPGIDDSVVDALREFGQASIFRRCCMAMMAWNLSYDERHEVSAYFTALDAAKDGHITRVELQAALQDRYHVDEDEVEQILDAMDSNGDEEIHYSDFLAAMVSTKIVMHDETLKATFQKFDTDRTGCITEKNLREVLGDKFNGVRVNTLMMDLSLSKHNQMSYREFEAYLRSRPLTPPSSFKLTKVKPRTRQRWLQCLAWCSV